MRDFTRERNKIEFKVDDDVFTAKSPIPAQTLIDFAQRFSSMTAKATVDDQVQAFTAVLRLVLMPVSFDRFTARMSDPEEPIEIAQIEEIVEWLFEEYGLRPTEMPSDSSDGQPSPVPGTSLTGSTPAVESISLGSPSISS